MPRVDSSQRDNLLEEQNRHTLPNGVEVAHLNGYETDYLYEEIFADRAYLKHGVRLDDGACVVDVGANIGLFTLFVQANCKDPIIYSFEPSPADVQMLINERLDSTVRTSGRSTTQCRIKKEKQSSRSTVNQRCFSSLSANRLDDQEALRAIVVNMLRKIRAGDERTITALGHGNRTG